MTENDTINPLDMEFLYNGGGVAAGDFNGDGWTDIFFTGNQVSNRCYLNLGKFRFEDITEGAGLLSSGFWANGASVADVNADGKLDIYVCNSVQRDAGKRRNLLFVNQGNDARGRPRFLEMADAYGLSDTAFSVQAAFFDYDLDGDLDMYLVNTKLATRKSATLHSAPDTGKSDFDRLFKNDWDSSLGHPVFKDVSAAAGIDGAGYGLGIVVSDLNLDGWPDVYVTNDYFSNDVLYINQRNGRFRNETATSLMHTSQNAMGCDAADLNNDGWPDLMAVDMRPEDQQRRQKNMGPNGYYIHQNMAAGNLYWQYVRNTLQLNLGTVPQEGNREGPVRFAEIAFQAGVAETDWSWSVVMADMDLDGKKDVLITNGYPKDVTDRDFGTYRSRQSGIESKAQIIAQMPSIRVSNYAYQQLEEIEFENRSSPWGMNQASFSNGAVCADLDGDGDLDYVVNNINDPAFVYENLTRDQDSLSAGYLHIEFVGPKENLFGLGARAEIFLQGGKRQFAENFPVRGYLSTQAPGVHFGLGNSKAVDSIRVTWPDGLQQTLHGPLTGQLSVKYENATIPATTPEKPLPHFEEVTAEQGLFFRHQEMDFTDFDGERLLPWKLSRQGPALCQADVNGDGRTDFFVSGSVDYPGVLFLQQPSGRFNESSLDLRLWPGLRQRETTDAVFLDADTDGDLDLYTTSGGNELPAGSPGYQDVLWINNGAGMFSPDTSALPRNHTSKSVVRLADFDGDGDMDLFIGGRCVPGKYPAPASSFLYRNDGKPGKPKFTDITQLAAAAFNQLGMVTDAAWISFLPNKGPSLVIVGEWMAPRRWDWHEGRLKEADSNWKFKQYAGFWQCIRAADLDGDGDQDLILGNKGWNTVFGKGRRWPVRLYDVDIDRNGIADPMITYQEPGRGEVPLAFRDDWIAQVPALRKRFPTYESFGNTTPKEILGEKVFASARTLQAEHPGSVIIWNEGTSFVVEDLPWMAQTFPVSDILVYDANSDGRQDLILCGNDYGNDVTNGRLDAGAGLVLVQEPSKKFFALTMQASGLHIPGDAKSIILIKSDLEEMLVLALHGETLHLFQKKSGF